MPKIKEAPVEVDETVADAPVSDFVEGQSVSAEFDVLFAEASLPFDKTHKRQGPGGRMLDYITGEQATSRMQEVYKTYDWIVTSVVGVGDSVIVSGTLSVTVNYTRITRAGVGSASIGGRQDAAGAAKTAETNAFKRAASKFGVGLYLYEKDDDDVPQYSTASNVGQARSAPTNLAPVKFPTNNSTGNGTVGTIERKSANGVVVNGQWYNVSKYVPIDISPYAVGETVSIAHAPGKTFIDGISKVGATNAIDSGEEF